MTNKLLKPIIMKRAIIAMLCMIVFISCKKDNSPKQGSNPSPPSGTLNPTEISLAGSWIVKYQAMLDSNGNVIPTGIIYFNDTNNCRLDLFTVYNNIVGNNFKEGYQGLNCAYSQTYWKATPTHLNLFGMLYHIKTLTPNVLDITFGHPISVIHLER